MRCYKDHVTNKGVRRKILAATGKFELLPLDKKRKQVVRLMSMSSGLTKTIAQGIVKGNSRKGIEKER